MSDTPVLDLTQSVAPKFVPGLDRKIKFLGGQSFEYEIFDLVDEYDHILTEKTHLWDFNNPPGDLRYIHVSMIQTMLKYGGVGLAANQVGLKYRTFVMGTGEFVIGVVNPIILSADGEDVSQEGCLSFPGLFLKVKRAAKIEVKFWDMNGVEQIKTYEGLTARIFLHEYDHLFGIRYRDLVSKLEYQRGKDKVKSNLKRMKRAREQAEYQMKLQAAVQKVKQSQEQRGVITLPTPEPVVIPTNNTSTITFDTPKSLISTEK